MKTIENSFMLGGGELKSSQSDQEILQKLGG